MTALDLYKHGECDVTFDYGLLYATRFRSVIRGWGVRVHRPEIPLAPVDGVYTVRTYQARRIRELWR